MNSQPSALNSEAPPRFSFLRLRRTMRLGLRSLWLHRLRSLLTVLGIVFGVCSVIAMLAIGEGASFEAQERIKNLGSQNIILRSVKPPEEQKVSDKGSQAFVLQYGLGYRTRNESATRSRESPSFCRPARSANTFGTSAGAWIARSSGPSPGIPRCGTIAWRRAVSFTDEEMESGASVCVLGSEMVPLLFPLETPMGKHVRIGGNYYRVVGVMEPLGQVPGNGESQDGAQAASQRMFIPLETAKLRYGEILIRQRSGSIQAERVELHELTVKVASLDNVTRVADAITEVLERHHKKKDYEIVVPLELLQSAERTKQIFNIVLGSIAAISLLVGGIGIMNIMLASVTERTREIGIRRALGATRRDVVTQFLVESMMLSGAGGLLGVLLGITIPFVVSYAAGMKTIITFWSPLVAFTISALVGVLFGIYPAMRAAEMDPVEALRHE